jgi:SNF2 family DNA or RNA helicase
MTIKVPNPAPRGKLIKLRDDLDFFDHQARGVRFHSRTLGSAVGDDMGLGKSTIGLARLAVHYEMNWQTMPRPLRYLIVTLANLKRNISVEIDEKTHFTHTVLKGTPTQRAKQLKGFDSDILIVGYEQVKIHLEELNAMGFDMTLFDEAHVMAFSPAGKRAGKTGKIRPASSARAEASNKLQSGPSYPMTGSIVTGQVDDLWAIMNKVAPSVFPSYHAFCARYGVYTENERHEPTGVLDPDGRMIYKVRKYRSLSGVKNEEELRRKIAPYFLRRTKDECMDLPDKMVIPTWLDMNPGQEKFYKQVKKERKIERPGTDPEEIDNALTILLRLYQITESPALLDPSFPDDSAKYDWVVNEARQHTLNGNASVIWTRFVPPLHLLKARFQALGITPWLLDGTIKGDDRPDFVAAWTSACNNGSVAPLIATIQSAGTGLNMQVASREFMTSKLYVPMLNTQAIDRCHRIGQTEAVQVWDVMCNHTMEGRLNEILSQKTDVFNAVTDSARDYGWKKRLIDEYLASSDDED